MLSKLSPTFQFDPLYFGWPSVWGPMAGCFGRIQLIIIKGAGRPRLNQGRELGHNQTFISFFRVLEQTLLAAGLSCKLRCTGNRLWPYRKWSYKPMGIIWLSHYGKCRRSTSRDRSQPWSKRILELWILLEKQKKEKNARTVSLCFFWKLWTRKLTDRFAIRHTIII